MSEKEDSIDWLRSRGVEVETPEDRKEASARQEELKSLKPGDVDTVTIAFVKLPCDDSEQCSETQAVLKSTVNGDQMVQYLKSCFTDGQIDMESLRQTAASKLIGNNIASSAVADKISPETLAAAGGSVEKFRLGSDVFLYLDEVGTLKSLPPNKHAAKLAAKCGFGENIPFFGDIYVCRYKSNVLRNAPFTLNELNEPKWMREAYEYQMKTQKDSGVEGIRMGIDDINTQGGEGKGKLLVREESDVICLGYSWTQTTEDIEVVLPLKDKSVSESARTYS